MGGGKPGRIGTGEKKAASGSSKRVGSGRNRGKTHITIINIIFTIKKTRGNISKIGEAGGLELPSSPPPPLSLNSMTFTFTQYTEHSVANWVA